MLNINTKETEKLDISLNFYKILAAWSSLNFKEDITIYFGKDTIWNNTNIKSNSKPFMFCAWLNKDIVFIEHIYDYRNKQFHSFNEI